MWLIFALLSTVFWAVVHVGDSHCVHDRFEKPWIGVTTSALASLIVLLTLPVVGPHVDWQSPEVSIAVVAVLGGVLIQVSQALYFQSLSYSEAGVVAAYWNMVPAMLPAASYVIFSRVLRTGQYLGISVLVVASVVMCLLDRNRKRRWQSLVLMFMASLMQVAALMLLDVAYSQLPYYETFLLMTGGIVMCGCAPLLLPSARRVFARNAKTLRRSASLFVAIEIANLIALAFSQRALDLGLPSLVAAVESTLPGACFLLSMLLWKAVPRVGDPTAFHMVRWKFTCVAAMVVGVTLLQGKW